MDKPRVSDEPKETVIGNIPIAEAIASGKVIHVFKSAHDSLIKELSDARRRIAELESRYKWRPVEEVHEDHGPCVYIDIQDPGSQLIAHVCDENYAEDIEGMTHFAPLPELTQEMVDDLIAAQRQKEGE